MAMDPRTTRKAEKSGCFQGFLEVSFTVNGSLPMDEQEARISWWTSVRGTNLTNWFFEVRGGSRVCFTCSRRMRFPYPYILFVLAAEASAAIVELD